MNTPRSLPLTALFCALFASSLLAEEDPNVTAAIAAEKGRGSALLAANLKALDAIMADDCLYTHSGGKLETKKVHINTFVAGLRYERFDTSDLRGHSVTPDVVVLNGTINQSKGVGGKMTDLKLLFQAAWRREGGVWRLVNLQTASTPAAPAKKT